MKAIIVLDEMQKGCACCPCSDDEDHFCRAKSEYYYSLGRPSWCPLKEIPAEKSIDDLEGNTDPLLVKMGYVSGWNACLEEIEK